MLYKSTRGDPKLLNFKDVTLTGLATDGGLYVPNDWQALNFSTKKKLTFQEVSFKLISQFIGKSIEKSSLKKITLKT